MKYLRIAALGLCLAGLGTNAAFARDGSLGIVPIPATAQPHPAARATPTLPMPDLAGTHIMLMNAVPSDGTLTPGTGGAARPAFVYSPVG